MTLPTVGDVPSLVDSMNMYKTTGWVSNNATQSINTWLEDENDALSSTTHWVVDWIGVTHGLEKQTGDISDVSLLEKCVRSSEETT
jgi:hypothetical protein